MSSNRVTIRLKANGLPCWHIIEMSLTKAPLLKRLQDGEDIDVTSLGRIIESGWGEPPQEGPVDYSTITA